MHALECNRTSSVSTKKPLTPPNSFTVIVMLASAARPPVALSKGNGVVGDVARTIVS